MTRPLAPRTLDDVIASLPKDEREKVEARARDLIAEETRRLTRPAAKSRPGGPKHL